MIGLPEGSWETALGSAREASVRNSAAGIGRSGGNTSTRAAALWKTSKDFESMFLSQMYKAMRRTVDHSEFTKPSMGREVFTEFLDNEYANQAAGSSPNGLACLLYRNLLRQEGLPPSTPPPPTPAPHSPAFQAPPPMSAAPVAPATGQGGLAGIVEKACNRFGVDSALVLGVIRQESAGDAGAVSPAGAKGLMQLMDSTATEMGVSDPFDPEENVMGGVQYLKQMLDRYGGDERLALAAYNAGPGAVDRHGGVPPYAETRQYVEKILAARRAGGGGISDE